MPCHYWVVGDIASGSGCVKLLCKIDPNIHHFDSYFVSGIYNHVLLLSISPRGTNTALVLPRRNATISWPILSITVRSWDAVLREVLWRWVGLKDDLTNYRLNSSIHMTQPVSFSTGKPSFWRPSEGVLPRIAWKSDLQHPPVNALFPSVFCIPQPSELADRFDYHAE